VKDVNIPLLYITLTRGGELFDGHGDSVETEGITIAKLQKVHMEGKSPLTIDMRKLSEKEVAHIEHILFTCERPACKRFFEGRGVNFRDTTIELWPTEIFLCGGHGLAGVRINPRAETRVPGLYSAGDNSLVARGHLTGAFTFGEIAAENAVQYCRSIDAPALPRDQIDRFVAHIDKRLAQKNNKIPIEECEFKIRRMINDYIAPPKNQDKLERACKWMDQFYGELDTMAKVADVHDLFKILEVESIITCGKLAATASNARKESRWIPWHYRTDYPETDNANWQKHILLTMGKSPLDIQVSLKDPVRLDIADPGDN
jgi:succinate dehydrogenase/fumarate reductase flavoprotein subunit